MISTQICTIFSKQIGQIHVDTEGEKIELFAHYPNDFLAIDDYRAYSSPLSFIQTTKSA